MGDFFARLGTAINDLQSALFRYQEFEPSVGEPVDVAAQEQQLFALFDAYFAAEKVLDTAKKEFNAVITYPGDGEWYYGSGHQELRTPSKSSTNPVSLEQLVREKTDAELDWERGSKAFWVMDAARKAFDTVKQQIHDRMPHYVWVVHPASNKVFGISTGTWGHGEWHLHVRDADGKLFELVHQTYYE